MKAGKAGVAPISKD
jgi:hypothetical protein